MINYILTMNMKLFFYALLSISVLLASCDRSIDRAYSDDLDHLDEVLTDADEYVHIKEQRISTINNMLNSRGVTPLQQYHIYGQLYKEYQAYQFDKAKEMLDHQEVLALEMKDVDLLNNTLLEKAMLLTTSGFFLEADKVFESLDTLSFDKDQKVIWYNVRQKFLHDYNEYVRTSDIEVPDAGRIVEYQDKILAETPESSFLNRHIRMLRMIENGEFEKAYQENLDFISSLDKGERDYAVQTYWQGFICENLRRYDEMISWWVESAICDIRGAIKDNASLCSIAVNLTGKDETERAFRYIRLSLDDALFYNAKLRKVQIASTMPWIEHEYTESRQQQDRDKMLYMVLLSLVAGVLLVTSLVAVRMYARGKKNALEIEKKNNQLVEYNNFIADAEENLRKTNLDLVEANAAKEEYLGLFLSMCSGYLDKLKKTLSRDQYENELKNFYKTFDTSFLSLYPTFVDEFNTYLKEDHKICLKEGELLNTELRIFALIKLGITQSSHIASLLRYSVNTIYNYRAQVKNAVCEDREDFEEKVRKIGSKR